MSLVHPEPGVRVADRYALTERIATGGMGEVWQAVDEVLGRSVAVKLLRREYAADQMFLTRFRAEARHAASLSHPCIASVYDYGEAAGPDGTAYLVMELVPGEPLSARLARDGALAPDAAVALLQQAAYGLQSAHDAGLVHRDVKPANLLITPRGQVKVTDFGIARAGDQVPITRTGEVMGTAQYLSPEQAMGRPATASSDVYALGVVAYEVLAGRRPFDAENILAIASSQVYDPPDPLPDSVPGPLAHAVLTALAKDPVDRPASAAAFADALLAALDQSPGTYPLAASQAALAPRADVVERTAAAALRGVRGLPQAALWGTAVGVAGTAAAAALLITQLGGAADSPGSSPGATTAGFVTTSTNHRTGPALTLPGHPRQHGTRRPSTSATTAPTVPVDASTETPAPGTTAPTVASTPTSTPTSDPPSEPPTSTSPPDLTIPPTNPSTRTLTKGST